MRKKVPVYTPRRWRFVRARGSVTAVADRKHWSGHPPIWEQRHNRHPELPRRGPPLFDWHRRQLAEHMRRRWIALCNLPVTPRSAPAAAAARLFHCRQRIVRSVTDTADRASPPSLKSRRRIVSYAVRCDLRVTNAREVVVAVNCNNWPWGHRIRTSGKLSPELCRELVGVSDNVFRIMYF